jgi:hypothetical protein
LAKPRQSFGATLKTYKLFIYEDTLKAKRVALDGTAQRTRFGRGYAPVVETGYGMSEY